jgi:hypothetical protein
MEPSKQANAYFLAGALMANDPPTSLRMGFGYHQARKSGVGGIRQDRSPNQINKAIKENKAARLLREAVEADPDWGRFVEHWILEGMTAEVTYDALYRARAYARYKGKGYSLNWRMRYWW